MPVVFIIHKHWRQLESEVNRWEIVRQHGLRALGNLMNHILFRVHIVFGRSYSHVISSESMMPWSFATGCDCVDSIKRSEVVGLCDLLNLLDTGFISKAQVMNFVRKVNHLASHEQLVGSVRVAVRRHVEVTRDLIYKNVPC